MRPALSSGLALLVFGAFGCGGSLRAGADGSSSVGVGGDGGATSVDGAAYIGDYTWGDVMVHVAQTSIAPGTFVLEVTDLTTTPNVAVTSTYQSASGSNPLSMCTVPPRISVGNILLPATWLIGATAR